jgi:hypothetical protein
MSSTQTGLCPIGPPHEDYVTNTFDRHGVQGELNRASNALLENEFGTKNTDEVVQKILEKGEVQEVKVSYLAPPLLVPQSCANADHALECCPPRRSEHRQQRSSCALG